MTETDLPERSPGRRARDRRRDLFDRLLPGVVAGILVALGILAVLSVVVLKQQGTITENQDAAEAALERQRQASAGGCARLQLVRDDINVQAWVQYRVISLSQGGPNPEVIQAALARVDPATRDLLRLLLKSSADAARLYPSILASTKYLPPTNCEEAVADPEGYRAPEPIPFGKVVNCYDPNLEPRPEVPCPTKP